MYHIISKIRTSKEFRDIRIAVLLIFLLGVMTCWRFLLVASSSRYWIATLIPMLLLVGYLIYGKWHGIGIARLILAIVICGFVAKDLRLNWNNRAITNAAAAIVADAQQYDSSFCSEIENSEILSRIAYYSDLPVLPYEDGVQLETLIDSAKGLYDACYIVTMGIREGRTASQKKLEQTNAKLIFCQDKDMRRKKQICVYKVLIDRQEKKLPIIEELWPNGGFENIFKRVGREPFAQDYDNIFNVVLSSEDTISGNYSLYCKSDGLAFVYSTLVSPPEKDGTILFSVSKAPGARVGFYIWRFDKAGQFLSRKIMMNVIMPQSERLHQFQIPFSAKDFADATKIRCYWYLSAPHGLLLDDFGVFK